MQTAPTSVASAGPNARGACARPTKFVRKWWALLIVGLCMLVLGAWWLSGDWGAELNAGRIESQSRASSDPASPGPSATAIPEGGVSPAPGAARANECSLLIRVVSGDGSPVPQSRVRVGVRRDSAARDRREPIQLSSNLVYGQCAWLHRKAVLADDSGVARIECARGVPVLVVAAQIPAGERARYGVATTVIPMDGPEHHLEVAVGRLTGTVSGRVLSARGGVISGSTVVVLDTTLMSLRGVLGVPPDQRRPPQTISDAFGRWEIPGVSLGGTLRAIAHHPDYDSGGAEFTPSESVESRSLDLVLRQMPLVRVTIRRPPEFASSAPYAAWSRLPSGSREGWSVDARAPWRVPPPNGGPMQLGDGAHGTRGARSSVAVRIPLDHTDLMIVVLSDGLVPAFIPVSVLSFGTQMEAGIELEMNQKAARIRGNLRLDAANCGHDQAHRRFSSTKEAERLLARLRASGDEAPECWICFELDRLAHTDFPYLARRPEYWRVALERFPWIQSAVSEDGSFELAGLPPGDARLVVLTKGNHPIGPTRGIDPRSDTAIDLRMSPRKRTLRLER